ncbi:histone-like nucleoid-structuring protein Lsr2 [Arthrobacter sp. RAF14]|uniref:histone-like nucleoid-structuring protein Lsr2 n=1 Tax=Arthrobacter sp. RAF14 TaxID=3233051 RepID=UPI003F8E7C16
MATRTVVHRFSDISGEALDPSAKPASFSVDGTTYEIDLTNSELAVLHKSLAPYVRAARQVTGKRSGNRPRPSKPDLERIREWAAANGHTVSPRGRIAQKVLVAYDAAHSQE